MKTAWFIGNRKLISALPWWRQWLVRVALWAADWTCSDEIHGNTITFSKDRAVELASREGWFKLELPIDLPLPEEAVNFGDNEDQFPLSDTTYIYHRNPLESVPVRDLRQLNETLKTLAGKAASA